MSSNTVVRHGTDLRGDEIVRYTFVERVCHWIAGFSYLYVLATGLALFTPYLYWLAYVLGGGPTIRFWHPWVGLVFVASTLWMHKLCNSGQKQFYWIMFYGGLLLLVTGIVMWFPELMPRSFHWVLPIVVFLHCVGALATIAGFIIHVYMGIFFVKGGLHGILFGRVPAAWVRAHHRLWYEKVIKEDRSRVSSTSMKGDR